MKRYDVFVTVRLTMVGRHATDAQAKASTQIGAAVKKLSAHVVATETK